MSLQSGEHGLAHWHNPRVQGGLPRWVATPYRTVGNLLEHVHESRSVTRIFGSREKRTAT